VSPPREDRAGVRRGSGSLQPRSDAHAARGMARGARSERMDRRSPSPVAVRRR
jgi:hypothetical protein